MTIPIETFKASRFQIVLGVITFVADFCILGIPFSNSTFEDGGITWHRNIWFFGAWVQYNRLDPEDTIGGSFRTLPGFSPAILILLLLGLIISTLAVFFIGKNKWRSVTFQRIASAFIASSAISGFIGTMLFIQYCRIQTEDPSIQYFIGFYIAAIYFPLLFITSFRTIIFSAQLPKPEITPAPPQEGKLLQEEEKLKKKRKLFSHLDAIEKSTKDK